MSVAELIFAAAFLEYQEEAKARGEVPCSHEEFMEKMYNSQRKETDSENPDPLSGGLIENEPESDNVRPKVKKNATNSKSLPHSKKNSNSGLPTREAHNKLEKNRRAQMKENFNNVKKLLPSINQAPKKASNVEVLDALRKEVKFLEENEILLLKEKDKQMELKVAYMQRLEQLKLEVPNYEMWIKSDIESENNGESTTTASECGTVDETEELRFSTLRDDESTQSGDEMKKSEITNASRPSVLINPKGEKWNLQGSNFDVHCERGSPILFASLTGAATVNNNTQRTNTFVSSLCAQSQQDSNQSVATSTSIQSSSPGSTERISEFAKVEDSLIIERVLKCENDMLSSDSTSDFSANRRVANLLNSPQTVENTCQINFGMNVKKDSTVSSVPAQISTSTFGLSNIANLVSVCNSELSLLKKAPGSLLLSPSSHSLSVPNKAVPQYQSKVISKNGSTSKVLVALPGNNLVLKTEQLLPVSYGGSQYISSVASSKDSIQSPSNKVLLINTSTKPQNREQSSNLANHALLALSSPRTIIKQSPMQLSQGSLLGGSSKEVLPLTVMPAEKIKLEQNLFENCSLYQNLKSVPTTVTIRPQNNTTLPSSVLVRDTAQYGTNLQCIQSSKVPSSLYQSNKQSNTSRSLDSISMIHNYSVRDNHNRHIINLNKVSEHKSPLSTATVLLNQNSIQENVIVQLPAMMPPIELLMPSSKHTISSDSEAKAGMLDSTPPRNSSTHSILRTFPPSRSQISTSKPVTTTRGPLGNVSEPVSQLYFVSVPNRPKKLNLSETSDPDINL